MKAPIAVRTALTALAFVVASTAQAATVTYDFDALAVGNDNAASQLGGRWSTWNDAPGTVEDGDILNNPSSGSTGKVLHINANDDVVLSLGAASSLVGSNWQNATPSTSGIVTLGFDLFVASGTGVYWNIQGLHGGVPDWAMEVYYGCNISGVAPGEVITAWNFSNYSNVSFPGVVLYDQWVRVEQTFNLASDSYALSVGGTQLMFINGLDNFSIRDGLLGVDFYASDGVPERSPYYMDNFSVTSSAVPEPASATLFAFGLVTIAAHSIRRRA